MDVRLLALSNEDTYNSVWSIIGNATDGAHVQLKHEIVNFKLRLNETQAGITLNKELEELIKDQKETARKLQELAQNQDDEIVVRELNKQQAENEVKICKTAAQLRNEDPLHKASSLVCQEPQLGEFLRRTWFIFLTCFQDAMGILQSVTSEPLALPSFVVADPRSFCSSFTRLFMSFTALPIHQYNVTLIRVPLGF